MAESSEMLPNSSEDHVCIEIGKANKLLAAQMGQKLSETSPLFSRCCIYRVHNTVRTDHRNAYEPHTVSIGPFHCGKESLQATKKFKWLYLYSLLHRAPTPQSNLEYLIEAIRKLEQVSRECYEEDINMSSDEFVEMMLIDGCFILEMFRREADEVPIDGDDPVFRTAQMHFNIKRDMILLENQIPLLILECIFLLTRVPENKGRTLIELCLNYLDGIVPVGEIIDRRNVNHNPKHLLDLLHMSFIPPTMKMEFHTPEHINCATELHDAGVAFKKKDKASSLFDITFKDGVFMIPPLKVEDFTESLFRNLIALEQCYGNCDLITSYVCLMDNLISSNKDVELLRNEGIIFNSLGSDEELSAVVNKLCKEVVLRGFQFRMLCEDVNKYYRNICHKWQARLKREYFSTPWKVASFAAAVLLLLLTTTATVFAILSFAVHGS